MTFLRLEIKSIIYVAV